MLEPLMPAGLQARRSGLTLIELLVGMAVVALLVTLAAPAFTRMIDTQRLRSVNAGLITDMQLARAEAVSRNSVVKVRFDKTGSAVTCYVILIGNSEDCNCNNAAGSACSGAGNAEIRTVQVDRSLSMTVGIPDSQSITTLGFDPATGRLLVVVLDVTGPPSEPFQIEVKNNSIGGFLNKLEATGRPSVCSPDGRISGVTPCPTAAP